MDFGPSGQPLRPWTPEAPLGLSALSFRLNQPFPEQTVNSCIALYLTWKYWIPRKTYHLTILDVETTANTIRWELELPPGIPVLPDSDQFLVPIAIFNRETPLVAGTLSDDTGREVQLLTARENQTLTNQMHDSLRSFPSNLGKRLLEREVIGRSESLKRDEEIEARQSVRRIQSRLGFKDASGVFDEATEDAVKGLQKLKGLEDDGIVGPQTAAALMDSPFPEDFQGSELTGEQRAILPDPNTGYLQIVMMSDPTRLRRSLTLQYETATVDSRSAEEVFPYLESKALRSLFPSNPEKSEPSPSLPPFRLCQALRRRVHELFSLDSSRLAINWPISGLGDAERSRVEIEVPPELEIDAVAGFWLPPREDLPESYGKRENDALPIEAETTSSRVFFLPADTRRLAGDQGSSEHYADIREVPELPHLWATWRDQPAPVFVFLRPRWEELRDSFLGLGLGSVVLLLAAGFTLLSALLVDPGLVEERVNKVPLAAVVAFTASIATSILIQRDRNEMAGFLLKPVRLRLAGLGLLPVLAAVTIAIPVQAWINGLILLVLALVELLYTLRCRKDLKDGKPEILLNRNEALSWFDRARVRFVRDVELFRKWDFHERDGEKESPLTDSALMGAAQEFAASAGWHEGKNQQAGFR